MKAKKAAPKPAGNQMPSVIPLRRGSPEYREAQRVEFNKRFEAQKQARQS